MGAPSLLQLQALLHLAACATNQGEAAEAVAGTGHGLPRAAQILRHGRPLQLGTLQERFSGC